MPISFLLNTTLHASAWLITQSYYGISYMIYGPRADPVVTRLKKIEDQLAMVELGRQDLEYYWNTRSKYENGMWVVISAATLVKQSESKWLAMTSISDHLQYHPNSKYTLLQVGSETSTITYI